MSNPVDEYFELKAGIQKTSADVLPMARVLGRSVASGAAMAGGFGLATAAVKAYQAMTKKRDFDEMIATNPDLAAAQQADPVKFNQHYNALRRMNPQFAAEPIVAGSYMRQMAAYPESAGKVVVEALQAGRQGGPQTSVGVSRGEPSVTYRT